ncbi:MAG: VOC family protein [Bacteroidetes bacterium]|nr:VOC family protein [Bacteroidota bacterium]
MARVVHFEIHAQEPARAAEFYKNVFNWEISQWGNEQYWIVKTGEKDEPGIDGGIMKRHGEVDGEAVIAYVCTIDVDSLDYYGEKVINSGGENVVAKMAVPGIGWLAYFKDTEKNIFGIMQSDPEAK